MNVCCMYVCMYECMYVCEFMYACMYVMYVKVCCMYVCMNVCEGEATRLAELALIFIPTVFIALSAKYRSQLCIHVHYK